MRILHDATDIGRKATSFVTQLQPRERATVVTLGGELGAGKMTFAQAVAKALGVEETRRRSGQSDTPRVAGVCRGSDTGGCDPHRIRHSR